MRRETVSITVIARVCLNLTLRQTGERKTGEPHDIASEYDFGAGLTRFRFFLFTRLRFFFCTRAVSCEKPEKWLRTREEEFRASDALFQAHEADSKPQDLDSAHKIQLQDSPRRFSGTK